MITGSRYASGRIQQAGGRMADGWRRCGCYTRFWRAGSGWLVRRNRQRANPRSAMANADHPEPCALEDAVVLDDRIKVGQVERIDAFHAVELGCNASLLS